MKTSIMITLCIFCFTMIRIHAQDIATQLNDAQTAYASHSLDNARITLQNALQNINQKIGQEILNILPEKMKDISFNQKDDNITGTAGFAGLFVNRTYGLENKNIKIEIISDSPLIASINALLSMPVFMSGSGNNNKKVKINGYKGLLNINSDDTQRQYTLQIPMGQTLITVTFNGNYSENEIISQANTVPLSRISEITR